MQWRETVSRIKEISSHLKHSQKFKALIRQIGSFIQESTADHFFPSSCRINCTPQISVGSSYTGSGSIQVRPVREKASQRDRTNDMVQHYRQIYPRKRFGSSSFAHTDLGSLRQEHLTLNRIDGLWHCHTVTFLILNVRLNSTQGCRRQLPRKQEAISPARLVTTVHGRLSRRFI